MADGKVIETFYVHVDALLIALRDANLELDDISTDLGAIYKLLGENPEPQRLLKVIERIMDAFWNAHRRLSRPKHAVLESYRALQERERTLIACSMRKFELKKEAFASTRSMLKSLNTGHPNYAKLVDREELLFNEILKEHNTVLSLTSKMHEIDAKLDSAGYNFSEYLGKAEMIYRVIRAFIGAKGIADLQPEVQERERLPDDEMDIWQYIR